MKTYKHPKCSFMTVVEIPGSEISKIDFALCRQPTESLETYYNRQIIKPHILTNGGFFNMSNGATCFNFIDEREIISSTDNYKWGMGVVGTQLHYGHMDKVAGIQDFVSGYPNLIDGGKIVPITFAQEINYLARRTVIGYNKSGAFMVTVDAPGLRLETMQQYLQELGITYAINLDGGGSTRMLIEGRRVTDDAWSRPVDNVVAFYLKEPDPTLYRVQVGAYGVKANADKMQAQIRALTDTIGAGYRNAYVRYLTPYYKVQVGAFSVKANAQKVVDDLAKKSISSFITDM